MKIRIFAPPNRISEFVLPLVSLLNQPTSRCLHSPRFSPAPQRLSSSTRAARIGSKASSESSQKSESLATAQIKLATWRGRRGRGGGWEGGGEERGGGGEERGGWEGGGGWGRGRGVGEG